MTHAALWINGARVDRRTLTGLGPIDLAVAADGGLGVAKRAGHAVDVLVGDLDSVNPVDLESFEGEVVGFPADKDFTDLELALDLAIERGATRLSVVGGGGGRLDHELSSLLVLTRHKYAGVRVEARLGPALVHVVRTTVELVGSRGEHVSLFAVAGKVMGVTTSGLRWPLRNEALDVGETRGTSNEFANTTARVQVGQGVLLVVQPQHFG